MRQKPVQFEDALKLAANLVLHWVPRLLVQRHPYWVGSGGTYTASIAYADLHLGGAAISYVSGIEGPVLAINVYERNLEQGSLFEGVSIPTASGFSVRRHRLAKPLRQGEGFCRSTYVAPLAKIIQETRESTVKCMAEVLTAVRDDHWPEA